MESVNAMHFFGVEKPLWGKEDVIYNSTQSEANEAVWVQIVKRVLNVMTGIQNYSK